MFRVNFIFIFHELAILSQLLHNAYCLLFHDNLKNVCVTVTVNYVVLIRMIKYSRMMFLSVYRSEKTFDKADRPSLLHTLCRPYAASYDKYS